MYTPTKYRPDIDGLRAIAVLAVILYHFKIDGFNGGLTGVDIFFVISGYLITGIIIREVAAGTFSLLHFWERRIRRIIPALVVVVAVTTVVSYFYLLLPSDFAEFGRTLMAQSAFLSNWWFMGSIDYFSASVETMPLLHTWTLAIEEQFYLLFPLFFIFIYPYVPKRFGLILVGAAVLSFIYGVFLVNGMPTERFTIPYLPHLWGTATNESAGFYFIIPRFWEFLVGGIIAVYSPQIKDRFTAETVSLIGIGTIFAGIFLLKDAVPFPGLVTLIPVLGTAAVIVANSSCHTTVRAFLSFPIIVWVGLLSYSLYLWHWPVLVFARYQQYHYEQLSMSHKFFLLFGIFFLSYLTYRYVETPFRKKRYLADSKKLYFCAALSLIALFGTGLFITLHQGFPERLTPSALIIATSIDDTNPRKEECFTRSEIKTGFTDQQPCLLGIQDPTQIDFVLWGDSHANATMPAFDEYGSTTNQTGIFFGVSGCAPLVSTPAITGDQQCLQENEKAVAYIQKHTPKEVFLVAEWAEGYTFVESEHGPFLSMVLSNTIEQLPKETKITILRRLPTFDGYDYRDFFLRVQLNKLEPPMEVPRDYYKKSHQPINTQVEQGLAKHPNAQTIDPFDTMCTDTHCYTGTKEGLYYSDSSHLSTFGAKQIILPLLLSSTIQPPATPQ